MIRYGIVALFSLVTLSLGACFLSGQHCQLGAEGCHCDAGWCQEGLVCLSNLCVDPESSQVVCGDGEVENPEECDDGNEVDDGNGCDGQCKRNDECGNGQLEELYEECDDGNRIDDGNGCNADCSANIVCSDGSINCVELAAADQDRPTSIAADDQYVYWTNWGTNDSLGNYQFDGSVMKIPLEGGEPVVMASGLFRPFGIRLDDTHIYWFDDSDENSQIFAELKRLNKAGGEPFTLVDGIVEPIGPAIDETFAYWIATYQDRVNVMRRRLDLAADARAMAYGVDAYRQLVSGPDNLYWFGYPDSIFFLDKHSNRPELLRQEFAEMYEMHVVGEYLFYSFGIYDGFLKIAKVHVNGGMPVILADPDWDRSLAFKRSAVDDQHVYWFAQISHDFVLSRSEIIPGKTEQLLSFSPDNPGSDYCYGMATSATHVYWITEDQILRIAK